MVRILLAVTHHLLRAALLDFLGTGEFQCAEVSNADGLWDQLRLGAVDVLILDLSVPGYSKWQTVQTLHALYPNVPILAISFAVDLPAYRWRDAGASGFVSKANLGAELLQAVRILSRGGTYFSEHRGAEKIP